MSFRKRNVIVSSSSSNSSPPALRQQEQTPPLGVRPSPLDGRLTTSTGTQSLDQLLAGHNGFPLGTSLLIQEAGTTDFGGTLLRYFAGEGLVQGHNVHLLGYGDVWRRELPGMGSGDKKSSSSRRESLPAADDKMKIAWRYETLGNAYSRNNTSVEPKACGKEGAIFCHSFDLTKRLENSHIKGKLFTSPMADSLSSQPDQAIFFKKFLSDVAARIKNSPTSSVHRIVVPSLLSPTLYSSGSCRPYHILQFLHGLRALLRRYPGQIVAMATLPISLFPRSAGLTRWMELLFDGCLELIPLQQQSQIALEPGKEDKSQGLLRVHSLPVFHEKGGGLEGSWSRKDLSFKLSASSGLVITPYSLPPVGEEEEAAKAAAKSNDSKKESLDF
ncbi:elongator complex protein 4 [Geosmithia morbida]|uniref:Elongator complex protein 4 n=1 Tax=Geosmithia morbida TaxID=1094350 RepID=A0A9P5D720_9HYPO|nr:elongator complex protein 4 [Geosmithia morbida]KAF4125345.1 elongator complex protein 4 [Geosmithia morbida]